jgi:hypothetical protein
MPILLGLTLGFIMKAVGPGLCVPAMFELEKQGLGTDKGARLGWAAVVVAFPCLWLPAVERGAGGPGAGQAAWKVRQSCQWGRREAG